MAENACDVIAKAWASERRDWWIGDGHVQGLGHALAFGKSGRFGDVRRTPDECQAFVDSKCAAYVVTALAAAGLEVRQKPEPMKEPTIEELQAEIGRLTAALHFRILDDPRECVTIQSAPWA